MSHEKLALGSTGTSTASLSHGSRSSSDDLTHSPSSSPKIESTVPVTTKPSLAELMAKSRAHDAAAKAARESAARHGESAARHGENAARHGENAARHGENAARLFAKADAIQAEIDRDAKKALEGVQSHTAKEEARRATKPKGFFACLSGK